MPPKPRRLVALDAQRHRGDGEDEVEQHGVEARVRYLQRLAVHDAQLDIRARPRPRPGEHRRRQVGGQDLDVARQVREIGPGAGADHQHALAGA
jgi:hypothetical protein